MPANGSLAVWICIQLFWVSAAGTPAAGRHLTAEISAGSTGLLCSRKGRVWTCIAYSVDLAIAGEGIYFVHKAEQVSSVAWDL